MKPSIQRIQNERPEFDLVVNTQDHPEPSDLICRVDLCSERARQNLKGWFFDTTSPKSLCLSLGVDTLHILSIGSSIYSLFEAVHHPNPVSVIGYGLSATGFLLYNTWQVISVARSKEPVSMENNGLC